MGLVSLLALSVVGCTPAIVADYCAEYCDCERCNDTELEECEIRREGRIDYYAIYDCDDLYIEYLECVLDEADCDQDDDWYVHGDDCDHEREDYRDCYDDGSKEELIDVD